MFIVMCTSGWITCWITMYCIFMIFHRQHFAFFIHTITTTTTSTLVLVLTPSPQFLISICWLYALYEIHVHKVHIDTIPLWISFQNILHLPPELRERMELKEKSRDELRERMRTARIWQKVGWQHFLSSISKVENDAKNMIKIGVNFKNRKWRKKCVWNQSLFQNLPDQIRYSIWR